MGHGAAGAGLWVAPVEDDGSEPLFGAQLARALAREAVDRADAHLAPRGEAAVHLAVQVNGIQEVGAAFAAGDVVREYRLVGEVTATATRPGGEVLWRGRGIRADREFSAAATTEGTEAAKARALELVARDLAREVLRRLALVRSSGEAPR